MDESILFKALNAHLSGDYVTAADFYDQIEENFEDKSFIYFLLGDIEKHNGNDKEALEYLNKPRALNCNVDFLDDFANRDEVIMLLFMMMIKERNIFRMESWEKALTLKPVICAAYVNTSVSYLTVNDINNALRVCDQGLDLYPDNLDLMLNKSGALLRSGFIEEGWAFYEARIQIYDHHKLKFPEELKPKYDGSQEINNKTVYVYNSAGFGDTIHFARYLPLLIKKGAKVIVKPHSSLVSVFKDSGLEAEILDDSISDDSIDFDYQVPFMSLGNAFKSSIKTIPFRQSYLKSNPEKADFYLKKYCRSDKFKIGIFWQGSNCDQRAFTLENLLSALEVQNVQLYSFQKGLGMEQLADFSEKIDITNLGITFNDFSDTAAAIECMDLLVGCDTSISNLAAAMGKPVWVILPYFSNWRWGLFSEKTSWYDSARLFRQKQPNNWEEVFVRVNKSLKDLLNSG